MTNAEQAMFAALSGASAVTALVGTRIYPVTIPAGKSLPAITYFRVSGTPERRLNNGGSSGQRVRVQVDCWATTYAAAKSAAAAVQTAAIAAGFAFVQDRDLHEEDLNIFRVSMDFMGWQTPA